MRVLTGVALPMAAGPTAEGAAGSVPWTPHVGAPGDHSTVQARHPGFADPARGHCHLGAGFDIGVSEWRRP